MGNSNRKKRRKDLLLILYRMSEELENIESIFAPFEHSHPEIYRKTKEIRYHITYSLSNFTDIIQELYPETSE